MRIKYLLKIVPDTVEAHNTCQLSLLMKERDLSVIKGQNGVLHALIEVHIQEMTDSGGFTEAS